MESVDDKAGRQPAFRQRGADDPRLARTHRRHRIEQMRHAGRAILDGLQDNGGCRFAVTDRNPRARRGQGANKACRNTFWRERDQGAAGTCQIAQALQVAWAGACDPIGPMNSRPPRTDEGAFQMQAEDVPRMKALLSAALGDWITRSSTPPPPATASLSITQRVGLSRAALRLREHYHRRRGTP